MIGIVDSSVAAKWYAAEPDSGQAERLLLHRLAAPDFILVEVANVLWKKVRKKELRPSQIRSALPHLIRFLILEPAAPLVERAVELALRLPHPVYDCVYLILSEDLDLPVITADKRLLNRARASGIGDRVIMLADWEEPHA